MAKDQDLISGAPSGIDENHLLSVLHSGSSGRNPTFFKAFGHEDVFGLKSAIPEGALEVTGDAASGVSGNPESVLMVQLPEGHPVLTGTQPDLAQGTHSLLRYCRVFPPFF